MPKVLVFQDKLGISSSYKGHWTKMLLEAGLLDSKVRFYYAQSYKTFHQNHLLTWKGNRKTPGFNEDPAAQIKTLKWMWEQIDHVGAEFLVIMDPALFFIVNNNWTQATTELLRGGVYTIKSLDRRPIKSLVMAPINSIHKGMKPKDIAALNNGFAEKDEWDEVYGKEAEVKRIEAHDSNDNDDDASDEEDEELRVMEWYAPIVIPYGEFCFKRDLQKLKFLLDQGES